jgi:serine/threonine-protein phosphatase 2A regulatory subunit A
MIRSICFLYFVIFERRNKNVFAVILRLIFLTFYYSDFITTHFFSIIALPQELLPFLTDGMDDEDEVLLAVATSLGRMVPAVGGSAQAQLLFRPLELLLAIEETTVRDAAAAAAQAILQQITDDDIDALDEYAALLERLAVKEWFTARISAAALLPTAFSRLRTPQQQQRHLDAFAQLCRDETPMVRRVAARHLGRMLRHLVQVHGREALEPEGAVVQVLLPLYEEMASAEQPDSVRLQMTENCVALGQVIAEMRNPEGGDAMAVDDDKSSDLTEPELALLRRVLPWIVATIDDRSWRVRWTAAAHFAAVIHAYDLSPGALDTLIPAYEKLLQDPEAEVRTAATFNLALVAQAKGTVPPNRPDTDKPSSGAGGAGVHQLGALQQAAHGTTSAARVSVAERLVQRVTSLTEDDSEQVRAALARVATELAPVLGKDATITYLVPPVLLLLRDAASEVRLNLISSLAALNEVIGVDLLSQSLLPAILDLAQDGKWRIRLAILQHIPLLAEQLGREFFTERLTPLCVGWLADDIATIRDAAARNVKELTQLFGTEWAVEHLLPPILEIREHASYLRRLTALKACAMMATAMDTETVRKEILPVLLDMATDVV